MPTIQKKIYPPNQSCGECHPRTVFTAYVVGGTDISVTCGVWMLGRLSGSGKWRALSLDQCPPPGWEEFAEECARDALACLAAGTMPVVEVPER